MQLELKEFEEKFRQAIIANAQQDKNEKLSYAYQVDLLKDKLEELEEITAQLRRELKESRCWTIKTGQSKIERRFTYLQSSITRKRYTYTSIYIIEQRSK